MYINCCIISEERSAVKHRREAVGSAPAEAKPAMEHWVIRDFKDTAYPFFESDTLFLECVVCVGFSCLAILRNEGCLKCTI